MFKYQTNPVSPGTSQGSKQLNLGLEELTLERFTQLARWIGMPECTAMRVLHFNHQGWHSLAKGKAWRCRK